MFQVSPVATIKNKRSRPEDDNWSNFPSVIELLGHVSSETILGLDAFSHIEVIFLFHLVSEDTIVLTAEHPRENPDWPRVGIFAQRKKSRPNRIGSTICRIEQVAERSISVRGLDAIDQTPVLDIKPVMKEFLPDRNTQIKQPSWSTELMLDYW
ncbi:MAG: tRNA (N6-threonylcarbamoyladenosine(37)-N6)-methyltransferase TrmO [Spirochaetaceae bacterium]|nr:tRNA (N6-threonylcarbamoyladenosine(37)-N6)-methyltransferase TrmO [Spirochaetaceae bacterium]|tara:strand:- start:136347 stop:136808 length:462 start_codon:yes stop_codon:yes gene_type:complete